MRDAEVEQRVHVGQGFGGDDRVQDELESVCLLQGRGGFDGGNDSFGLSVWQADGGQRRRVGRVKADDQSVQKREQVQVCGKKRAVGDQAQFAEIQVPAGVGHQIQNMRGKQGFAARQPQIWDSTTDDTQDFLRILQCSRDRISITARAEVLTIGAVQVATRGDVVDRQAWVKCALAALQMQQVAEICGHKRDYPTFLFLDS